MTGPRFICAGNHTPFNVFASTPKTRSCALTGRGLPFSGGSTDTRIVNEPVRVQAAILLRPKQGNPIQRLHAAGLARGRNLFAGGIYA